MSSPEATQRIANVIGLGLVIANPASVVTWVVIVGGFMGHASRLEGMSLVVGVGVGSATWFVLLAHLARRGRWFRASFFCPHRHESST